MMYNSQLLSQPGLPPSVMERNKKDRLYNDVLKMLEENNVAFPGVEVKTSGQAFLRAIVDCLWYLDGHHDALKKQNCPIPELFSHFNGYNTLKFQNIENDPFLTFQAPLLRCCHLLCFTTFKSPSGHVSN